MKTIKYIAAILAGVTAFSCAKQVGGELPAPQDGEGLITIKASIPDDVTKAGSHVGFSWYWQEGDKITVVGEEETQVFSIKEGFSSKNAEFVGRPVAGETFTILFPGESANTASWNSQSQEGNNSTDHLEYMAALIGVDNYTAFSFSPEWAQEHGGSIKQTGVMKIALTLPDDVTSVNRITLTAETPLFYKGNGDEMTEKLEVSLNDAKPDARHTVTAWMTTSWNEAQVPADAKISIAVANSDAPIAKTVTFTKASTLMSGKVNNFIVDATAWEYTTRYTDGDGTAAKPWIITSARQMSYIYDDLKAGEIRYFKLGADIDMSEIDSWVPLNAASPYDKQIDFDGDGHTISNFSCNAASYPSFFGVLYGKCHDVTFTNATITSASKGCGILGGYGGTSGKPCIVENVHLQGTVTCTSGNNVGGMFGTARECTIDRSSADVVVDSKGQLTGGLIGADAGLGVTITNCWTAGSVTTTASIAGGICGDLVAAGSSILNCYSTASVTTQFIFGGIVGRACAGQKTNATNCNGQEPQNHIENCIAWNDFLKSDFVTDTSEHYSSGAIIGGTAVKNYLKNCWRKSDLAFTDCPKNAELGTYALVDQDDADPDHPMVKGEGTYAFAYHGKAAAAGKNLSQVAQEIGWSSDVWDFSGSLPKLK